MREVNLAAPSIAKHPFTTTAGTLQNQENLHPNILANQTGRAPFDPLLSTTSYQTHNTGAGAGLYEDDLKPRAYPFPAP
jgi:hypothetical protein